VNDGQELEKTCNDLEEMGARGLILMRFANFRDQGLILGNDPIMPGITPHTIEEFRDLVTHTAEQHRFRVTGTPLWDPLTGAPFALARRPDVISRLPPLRRGASIITSRAAAPLLRSIFSQMESGDKVSILPVEKDIGCLITIQDFSGLDLEQVMGTVIIPGRTMAHEKEIKSILTKDGRDRMIIRGPDTLTVDGEMSISMNAEQVIDLEVEAFGELIEAINAMGV
jgi:methanogenesis marker radical SAM protein